MIKTTHVGSLPRTQEIVDGIFARENNTPYDQEAFLATLTTEVGCCVDRQAEVGIDLVSDGELSKISYATYIKDRYHGFSGDSPRNPPADLKQFPGFLKKIADSGGTPSYQRPFCTGEISSKNNDDLQVDINNLKKALEKHPDRKGFMNAASPGVIALFLPNQHYPDQESYLTAIGEAIQTEYRAIVDAGLYLQIDAPDLALARHMIYKDESDEGFIKRIQPAIKVLKDALAGLPPEKVRLHVCWGNYEGPHICDIGMEKVFSTLMDLPIGYLLFETSNPRHGHEWRVFEERKKDIPGHLTLIPGVIDSTSNFVEHPQVVADRIERFVNIVGEDRVIAGSDCGFATFAGFGAVDGEIAYQKLAALHQGVRLFHGS